MLQGEAAFSLKNRPGHRITSVLMFMYTLNCAACAGNAQRCKLHVLQGQKPDLEYPTFRSTVSCDGC